MACRGGAGAPLIERVRFAADSLVEGEGFEPSVPRSRERTSGRNQIFSRTIVAEAYVRRNKAADRLVRRAGCSDRRNGDTGIAYVASVQLSHNPSTQVLDG